MYQIIFLDFDNTLYSHKSKCFPDSTIEALRIAHEKGVKIFLCTGRPVFELREFDFSPFFFDGYITTNGQVAYNSQHQIIFRKFFSLELKEKIKQIFINNCVPTCLLTEDDYFINYVTDFVAKVQGEINTSVPKTREYYDEDLLSACCFYQNMSDYHYIKEIEDIATVTNWREGCVDIVAVNSTKATGIEGVLGYYGIDKENAIGIGDWSNDIPMLQYCGLGIAMGNALEIVKEAADYITTDIDDDGIYNALKHYEVI